MSFSLSLLQLFWSLTAFIWRLVTREAAIPHMEFVCKFGFMSKVPAFTTAQLQSPVITLQHSSHPGAVVIRIHCMCQWTRLLLLNTQQFVCKSWCVISANVLKSQSLFSLFFSQHSGLVFKGKSYSPLPVPFLSLPSIQRLDLQRKVISLSVPERIYTEKLHWIFMATFFFLAVFQTYNLRVNMQLK